MFISSFQIFIQHSAWGSGTQQTLRQKALSLSIKISTTQAHLQILDEEYLENKIKLSTLTSDITHTKLRLGKERQEIQNSESRLRQIAISEYTDDSATSSGIMSALPNSAVTDAALKNTYMETADNLIKGYMTNIEIAKYRLGISLKVLGEERLSAVSTTERVNKTRLSALYLTNRLDQEYSSVQGQLAAMVTQEENSKVAQNAFRETLNQSIGHTKPIATLTHTILTVDNFSAGLKAVQAAESQIGVPYIWGGAAPGVGFDCSGLAMWAWAQSGVILPHSAELQYMDTTRVSLNNLEPGDLIFYASGGYVYHVIIYAGSGPYGKDTAIQAEEAGTVISYTPIPLGAYAAGEP